MTLFQRVVHDLKSEDPARDRLGNAIWLIAAMAAFCFIGMLIAGR
jgi:hypothetical protein